MSDHRLAWSVSPIIPFVVFIRRFEQIMIFQDVHDVV
jgi:hypothetical protein